jgi:replicative DNA helicase
VSLALERDIELPHNDEAERSVLGAVLVNNIYLDDVVGVVQPEDFYRLPHERVFAAMLEMHQQKTPIDVLTLGERLAGDPILDALGGVIFLSRLMDGIPKLVNAKLYAGITKQRAVQRRALKAAHRLVETLGSFEQDGFEEAIASLNSSLEAVARQASGETKARPAIELTTSYMLDLADRMDGQQPSHYLPTGFRSFDATYGGLRYGSLVIVAGRPSQGKTSMGMTIGSNISDAHGVLFVTLEMTAFQLSERILSLESRVDSAAMATASKERQLTEQQFARLGHAHERMKTKDLLIVEPGSGESPTMGWLRAVSQAEIERRKREGKPPLRLIIVDYMQLMDGPERKEYDRITRISRDLKRLAKDLDVVVMAMSQLARTDKSNYKGGVPPRPDMDDLKGSGAIEADSDLVLAVHRPESYLIKAGKDPGNQAGKADLVVAKNRYGPIGVPVLGFKAKCCLFYELES